jgi:hypothetical protein
MNRSCQQKMGQIFDPLLRKLMGEGAFQFESTILYPNIVTFFLLLYSISRHQIQQFAFNRYKNI